MDQTISKKRKIMCVAGGVSLILLALMYVLAAMEPGSMEQKGDYAFLAWIIVLALIHLCDILSVFSQKFRSRLEAVENKLSFFPVLEIAILIISICGLIVGVGCVFILLIGIGLIGGSVGLILIFMLGIGLFSGVIIANMIFIIKSKSNLTKSRNNPQVNYPPQHFEGIESLGAFESQGSYDSQSNNNM